MQQVLHVDLNTYAAHLHVPRAKDAIKCVKESVKFIKNKTPFTKNPKRLMIEMVKRVTVLINSFNNKSRVHLVVSPRQILFGKKFKTPLCKIGELVMTYDVTANNTMAHSRAFLNYTSDQVVAVPVT